MVVSRGPIRAEHWGLELAIGFSLLLLGFFFFAFAGLASLLTITLLGTLLLVAGVAEIVSAFSRSGRLRAGLLTSGVLSSVVALLVLLNPAASLAVFTMMVAVSLLASGLYQLIASLVDRSRGWGWDLAWGVISLLSALWLISVWPAVSLVLAGILLGVQVASVGLAVIAQALEGRRLARLRDRAGETPA